MGKVDIAGVFSLTNLALLAYWRIKLKRLIR